MLLRSSLAALLAALALPTAAAATTTYLYQGNPFTSVGDNTPPAGAYDTSMSITASLTFQNAPPPSSNVTSTGDVLSWSFDDGRSTLTESNSSFLTFDLFTDANSDFVAWEFVLASTDPFSSPGDQRRVIFVDNSLGISDLGLIDECIAGPCSESANTLRDSGSNAESPGSWTQVPEPASAALLAAGLAGLGARRRR